MHRLAYLQFSVLQRTFQEEAQIRLSCLQWLVSADCRNGHHARRREAQQQIILANNIVNGNIVEQIQTCLVEHTRLSVTVSKRLCLFCALSCYGCLSWMAFSCKNGFWWSRGVNTWAAVWPGPLWGQQWVKWGRDVAAGRSLQLQTTMTLLTLWNYHKTFSLPRNHSNLSWWFADTYRMCFFSVPGRFQ